MLKMNRPVSHRQSTLPYFGICLPCNASVLRYRCYLTRLSRRWSRFVTLVSRRAGGLGVAVSSSSCCCCQLDFSLSFLDDFVSESLESGGGRPYTPRGARCPQPTPVSSLPGQSSPPRLHHHPHRPRSRPALTIPFFSV